MLVNNWYVACREGDLPEGRALGVAMLGCQVVVYRRSDGQLACLSGQCCHANAALAGARIEGDALICPDHCWTFGADGRCRAIPGFTPEAIPDWARIDSYPVFRADGWIWVFMGDEPNPAPPPIDTAPSRGTGSRGASSTELVVPCDWRSLLAQIGRTDGPDGFAALGRCSDWMLEGFAHRRVRPDGESWIACTPVDAMGCRLFVASRAANGAAPPPYDTLRDAVLRAAAEPTTQQRPALLRAAEKAERAGNLIDSARLVSAPLTRPYVIASPRRRSGPSRWVFRPAPLVAPPTALEIH